MPLPPCLLSQRFWLLLLTRGLVGVGEASYSTIAPTLIADLFVADQRSRMLSVFYFAIPVGRCVGGGLGAGWGLAGRLTDSLCPLSPLPSHSGLGYIAGSKVKDVAGDWHWALRVSLVIVWGVSHILADLPFCSSLFPF